MLKRFFNRTLLAALLAFLVALFTVIKFDIGASVVCDVSDVLQIEIDACEVQ